METAIIVSLHSVPNNTPYVSFEFASRFRCNCGIPLGKNDFEVWHRCITVEPLRPSLSLIPPKILPGTQLRLGER